MRLITLLLAATLVGAAVADGTYVVLAPSKIRPGIPCALSVNILNATSDVNVKAAITNSAKAEIASARVVFTQGDLIQLVIPVPHDLPSSSYHLEVTGSGGLTFHNSTGLSFESKQMSIFIQTDKAMYKPGDTVNFRVLGVYPDLKPYTGTLDIFISDASGNKIRQYISEVGIDGVVTKAISLSTQPVLGDWKISVNAKDQAQSKVFTIDEYVLPKFEVDVIMPSYVVSTDKEVAFTVKAKYTYGKPVQGKLDVAVMLIYSYEEFDATRHLPIFKTSLDMTNGEGKINFPMSNALAVTKYLNNHKLIVSANVTETLTGNTLSGDGSVKVYSSASKLSFPASNPKTFKPGLTYTAYLKVTQQDGVPVALSNTPVTVSVRVTALKDPQATQPPGQYWWTPPTESTNLPDRTLAVPVNGLVRIPLDIPSNATDVQITAKYDQGSAYLSIGKSYSPSSSYMQLSLSSSSRITAGSAFSVGVKATQPLGPMVYQVLSRGQIVQLGTVHAYPGGREVTFTLTTTSAMAPNARVVVYYVRQDGEIVTDSISFDVDGIFKNKVGISINQTQAEPGDSVKVTVTADPNSHAHLLAVDQSVLLLKSGNDITPEDVYSELESYDTISHNNDDIMPRFLGGARPMDLRRAKRMVWWPYPVFYGGSDATSIFQNAGVVVLTDALVFKHKEPVRIPIARISPGWNGFKTASNANNNNNNNNNAQGMGSLKTPTRIRHRFLEAWIWRILSVGSDGKAELMTSVPDTITSWVATAFAVNSNSGLGVAPSAAKFKVFRPFFVSLNLPYSVVRGEHVVLQAIVFNYMTTDQQVRVTLSQSNSFLNILTDAYGQESTSSGDAVQIVMVQAGEAKTVYFPVMPTDLGMVDLNVRAQSTQAADALRRQLLVEPEGVSKEYNIPTLIELQNGQFTKTVDVSLPPNTVSGSELVKVSVIGDLMGPSISGIDKLLRMPTGCGEQTMLGLAPDVYVTDYLTSTSQLMGDIKAKALGYMEKGYQRELTYKHKDGSFSAFGDRDNSGSMWLTAFVCKVFHQAKSHIYVDDDVIRTAINWMVHHQAANGSFPEPGRVIHKSMQGNAGSGVSLTAFVLVSLLENQDLYTDNSAVSTRFHNAKAKALTFVQTEATKSSDPYLLAMTSYALQLASSSVTDQILTRLDQMANHDGGLYHLHKPETKKATTGSWSNPHPTSAVDTEMTSYVLLTYAKRHDLAFGKKIMQWITQQRNANGGFSSTQDTVVALNALSAMAEQVFSKDFNVTVDVTMDTAPTHTFHIDGANAIIMQRRESKTVPAKIKIDARGTGTALVEVAVFFNVESEIEDTTFDLQVRMVEETLDRLKIETCAKWMGDGSASGMTVQEIGVPSGFSVDLETLPKINTLKRSEMEDKKVVLYFDEVSTVPTCLTFVAERTGLVSKSQPSPIRVYDYYEPTNQVTAFYQSTVLKNSGICDVCRDCGDCVARKG